MNGLFISQGSDWFGHELLSTPRRRQSQKKLPVQGILRQSRIQTTLAQEDSDEARAADG
jgi:hypothetical protein